MANRRNPHILGPRQERIPLNRRQNCRGCGGEIIEFLDFGDMPLAGAFIRQGEQEIEHVYPMTACFCPQCTLVQIPEVIPKEALFGADYRYFSSVTTTLNAHFADYADYLNRLTAQLAHPFVLEFGSNDGVLLSKLRDRGIAALGVDASANVVEAARARGLDAECGFFDEAMAQRLIAQGRPRPNVITGSNVFAHNDDVDEILRAVRMLLHPTGYFLVEVHSLADLLAGGQFDFFYHEHCNYYSLQSLVLLLARHDLTVVDAERIPMHGGALRIVARPSGKEVTPMPSVAAMLMQEHEAGLGSLSTYDAFANRVHAFRDKMSGILEAWHADGLVIGAYGASGRSVTLLNYLGPSARRISVMFDASPARAGTLLPGLHIPIIEPTREELAATDRCVVTAWPYAREILYKEDWYPHQGRAFLVPLPEMRLVADGEPPSDP